MVHKNQAHGHHKNDILGVIVGLLIGGLVGAITMLLLAPQSGEDTRLQIQEKGAELRHQTTGMMEDALAQLRWDRNQIVMGSRQKAHEVLDHGQTLAVEQLDRVSAAAQAGKKAIQSA